MATRRSGIPVKSGSGLKTQTSVALQSSSPRTSGIPVKKTKNVTPSKSSSLAQTSNTPKREGDLQEEIQRLENAVKNKDSAINDLNEKLMDRMNECQVLREENEAARENISFSTDEGQLHKIKDLENLLSEKETFIENMLIKKQELERKFEVELDMLKNQHEIEMLSLQQRLEEKHEEKMDELQEMLKNQTTVNDQLQREISGNHDQKSSTEINRLHEELMSTKLRYENQISELKQELEMEQSEKDDLIVKQENSRKKIDSVEERHKEETETLKYIIQEKDMLIDELKNTTESGDEKTLDTKLYSNEDVTKKLEELRRELTTEYEHNLELANELWRKKFEEQGTDSDKNVEKTDKLLDEISDLKDQLQEANDLNDEQTEILEVQEKDIEELKESNKEFQERYTTLYHEMQSKWQNEFSESEIIEKIKSHYELEIERLHGELEDIQNENSNLKTEVDLMAHDFDGSHSRAGAPVRKSSFTARLDMKAEIEDYKVQIAALERDLQHALNQNERLKIESGARNEAGNESKLEELCQFSNMIDELQTEQVELRDKLEKSKTDKRELERDLKSRDEERKKFEEEMNAKIKEIDLLKDEHKKNIETSEVKLLKLEKSVDELTNKCERSENELTTMRETLENSENHERDLEEALQEFRDKEETMTKKIQEAKCKISTLEDQLSEMNSERESAGESNKMKELEGQQVTEARKRVNELEKMLAQGRMASEALQMKYDKLLSEGETKSSRIHELEATLSQHENNLNPYKFKNGGILTAEDVGERGEVEMRRAANEEYEYLKKKYDQENEANSLRISEIETLFRQKNMEYETLNVKYNEQCKKNESYESRIVVLEAEINEQKSKFVEVESLNSSLQNENTAMRSRVRELEVSLKKSQDECVKLTSGGNERYEKFLEEDKLKDTKIDDLTREGSQSRKQITAFEKKVAIQEREKKSLEEKICLFRKEMEERNEEVENLKEKCESYLAKNKELKEIVETLKNSEETLRTYKERNQELLSVIEEATREKKHILAKQTLLIEENEGLKDEKDTLKNEMEVYESTREKDTSTHEQKFETLQKKLKEKDRVVNETKKHCRQLKDSEKDLKQRVDEREEKCLEFEGKIEELNRKLKHLLKEKEDGDKTRKQSKDLKESLEEKNKKYLDVKERLDHTNGENTKLKQLLQETKINHSENEQAWQEEIARQKNTFARELENIQENTKQSAQESGNESEELRREMSRLSQENHALKIRLDDLAIEVSKEKEEKYKMEKLKDQFRFRMQGIQERFEAENEKMATLQDEQRRGKKKINEERNKLLETLNEYESKNIKLISDIEKASSVLITTKEKYAKLKEKYSTLAKKYTKLNKEKMNKSDVQVGPDASVDLSLVVEDLQQSKRAAEETSLKLRAELDRLQEEVGRNEYQVKAVRKANVVLMKQSRCLYQESEEHKRVDEERRQELHKHREMETSLQNENETLKKRREMLEEQITKLQEETAKLRLENDEYFLAKNKTEIKLGEQASECVLHSRQLERLKRENEFLYNQGRKLQAELDVGRMKSMNVTAGKPDEKQNSFHGYETEALKYQEGKETVTNIETRKLSQGLKLSESVNSNADEVKNYTPPVFNNERTLGDKVVELSKNNADTAPSPSHKNYSGKDTNLQISRNIINNDFVTEKYLGKTYWDTLEFLKKK